MGSGGFCVCLKCDRRFPHERGQRCLDQRCPDCGGALVREESAHHQQIESRHRQADRANVPQKP